MATEPMCSLSPSGLAVAADHAPSEHARFATASLCHRPPCLRYLHVAEHATRQEAQRRGWEFELRDGNWSPPRKLFSGTWDEDCVVVQPGEKIVPRNDQRVLDAE